MSSDVVLMRVPYGCNQGYGTLLKLETTRQSMYLVGDPRPTDGVCPKEAVRNSRCTALMITPPG
jgi:hypothetical protein